MPRRSAASLSVVAVEPGSNRLRPPANLRGPERDLFIELIAANPPQHFRLSDMPLLTQYCAASVLSERALDELRRAPVSKDNKPGCKCSTRLLPRLHGVGDAAATFAASAAAE